jgi:hypothetical protein
MITQLQLNKMTREELEFCVYDLDEESGKLRATIEGQNRRLAEAADLMVDLGRIHDTPHAKHQWVTGN